MLESVHLSGNQLDEWRQNIATNGKGSKNEGRRMRAQIFLKRKAIAPKLINSIVYAKNLLQLKGISDEDVEEVVFEDEDDVQAHQILEQIAGDRIRKDFPVVFVDGFPIGMISDLEEWIVSTNRNELRDEQLVASIDTNVKPSSSPENTVYRHPPISPASKSAASMSHDAPIARHPSVTVADFPLVNKRHSFPSEAHGLVDSVVSNVGSAISLVKSYLAWSAPNESRVEAPPKETKDDERGVGYAEFEVVQVNWYYRQQKRILRFSNDKFFRLNPYTKEMRAVHKYSHIQEVSVTANNTLIFTFTDESPPEQYQSDHLEEILRVLISKSKPFASIPVKRHDRHREAQ